MSANPLPLANSTPTLRLRLKVSATGQYQIAQPGQARQCLRLTAHRDRQPVISARPRVTKAAWTLLPSPSPWQTPAAIATTFLSDAATSTPTGSWLVYRRKVGPGNALCTSPRETLSPTAATTTAAGSPRAISRANVGRKALPPWARIAPATRPRSPPTSATEIPFDALRCTDDDRGRIQVREHGGVEYSRVLAGHYS